MKASLSMRCNSPHTISSPATWDSLVPFNLQRLVAVSMCFSNDSKAFGRANPGTEGSVNIYSCYMKLVNKDSWIYLRKASTNHQPFYCMPREKEDAPVNYRKLINAKLQQWLLFVCTGLAGIPLRPVRPWPDQYLGYAQLNNALLYSINHKKFEPELTCMQYSTDQLQGPDQYFFASPGPGV